MELTKEETKQIEKLAKDNSLISKIYEELKSYEEDPTKIFYAEVVEMTKTLAAEMKLAREGKAHKCHILSSEDRLFERIQSTLVNSQKIFDGIAKGKEYIDPKKAQNDKNAEKAGEIGIAI